MLDERERRWHQKAREQGRKQVSFWLDGDTYQALQAIVAEHGLRGMGEAIRLLVDRRQAPPESRQAASQAQATPLQGTRPLLSLWSLYRTLLSLLQVRSPEPTLLRCINTTFKNNRIKVTSGGNWTAR
jgi:hypothetical protein